MTIGVLGVALLVRFLLDPLLGDLYPYATTSLAVLVAAGYFGPGPGIVSALVGAAAVSFFFIQPRGQFTVDDGTHNLGQVLNLTVSLGVAVLGGALYRARNVAERIARSERRHQERLNFALEQSRTGGWDLDLLDHTAHRTLAHDQIFGYESLLPEWSYARFLEHVIPEDRQAVDRSFQHAISTQSDWTFECRIRRIDGTQRWIWAAGGHLRDGDGPPQRLAGIVQDITERKLAEATIRNSEERMRFALENAEVGIWDMDYTTGVLQWSERLEAQYGLAPGTFGGTFEAFLERILPEDREPLLESVRRAISSGTDFTVRHRALWPDGQVRWLHGAGRILLDDDGQPVRGLGITLDVTEQRLLEQQYQQSQKMEAMGQLAGGVAHDFNNLLTAILGYCELLLADLEQKDSRRSDVLEIQKAGASAAGLTRQLLAFSRKQLIEPTLLNLNTVVTDMRSMLSRLIGEHIHVQLGLGVELGSIRADRGQVEQVVLNLVVNARDAMPKGGRITIETANVEIDDDYPKTHFAVRPGPHVMLAISDAGVGMTPEVQARLFEPFFTTKEQGKGTGLGLATVHGVVKQSAGFVNVYSEIGRGTSFKVYWPRSTDGATRAAPSKRNASLQGSETVLLVEDADGLRTLTTRLLERQGYAVLSAADAKSALQLFEQHPTIDVLLTDVVMPGASGPELARELRTRRPALKVVFMSGYTEDTIVNHGVIDSRIAFLHKPFSSETLGRKLRDVLDQ